MNAIPPGVSRRLSFTKVRNLDLVVPAQAGRPAHVSAASGLVCIGTSMYVVADDELHLGIFDRTTLAPGTLLRLRPHELELDPKGRKAGKPDFEALIQIRLGKHHGLLALGSGSRALRCQATWINLDAAGGLCGVPRAIDLQRLYAAAERVVEEVNIEGACVQQDTFLLFQRGNRRSRRNAVLGFELHVLLNALDNGELTAEPRPTFVIDYDLGAIDGVTLGFSDATTLPDGRIVFAAVAENTQDAYNDGPNVGSAIGMLDAQLNLDRLLLADQPYKVEGIHAELRGDALELLAVTDADDAATPAALLRASIVV